MASEKDIEQDEIIRQNTERITRNEEAIKRQTEALEKIRDHYYPKKTVWKRSVQLLAKIACAVFAYLGIAETVDWIWNSREANALAEKYADAAQRRFNKMGDAVGAMKCYEKATQIDPKESEYVMALSFMKGMAMSSEFLGAERLLTVEEQSRVDSALAEAMVMKELEPKNPMPCVLMAQALLLNGEKNEAAGAVECAVSRDPENASVRVSACAIQFFTGHIKEARAHLAEAERIDATLPLAIAWRGMIALMVDRDAATAKTCFSRVVRQAPRLYLGHVLLGRAFLAEEKPDVNAARESFRRALFISQRLVSAMLGMVETYELEGNLLVARLWCDRALESDERAMKALLARARINAKLNEWGLVADDLTRALAQDPFRSELYRERAKAKEKTGDVAGAEADRKLAESIDKSNEHSWY